MCRGCFMQCMKLCQVLNTGIMLCTYGGISPSCGKTKLKGLVWQCARFTTESEFNASMEAIKRKNEKAWVYLDKWPCESWTKAYFNENCKVDNITNNNCESFNAKILKFRSKPLLSLCKDIMMRILKLPKYKDP